MLKAIIVEDEEENRKLLSSYLKTYCPNVTLLGAFETVESSYEAIQTLQPDLVFLDIELQGETTFDLLSKFESIQFEIIFTTAFHHYSLKAIKLSATDYLLKPINIEELIWAVKKAEDKRKLALLNSTYEVLLNNLRTQTDHHQIAISSSDGLIFVKVANVIYLESDASYTTFYLKNNEKILTSRNLKEYEDILTPPKFFRIHKSHIVNMSEITKYTRGDGGSVTMSNNTVLEVSRRKKDEFLLLLEKI